MKGTIFFVLSLLVLAVASEFIEEIHQMYEEFAAAEQARGCKAIGQSCSVNCDCCGDTTYCDSHMKAGRCEEVNFLAIPATKLYKYAKC